MTPRFQPQNPAFSNDPEGWSSCSAYAGATAAAFDQGREYAAAAAADDRVITQAERAVDDRARGIRIEDVSTDTNDRAKDIQGRLP